MKSSFNERMAYRFDNYMAKGPSSIFFALLITFIIGFVILGVARFVSTFFIPNDNPFNTSLWYLFLQLTDPGNMAQDNTAAWYVKIFAIIAGMFGIIFFSAVIAFITTQLDLKLEELKKGRSKVLEKNHVLILGWNSQIVEIIRELIIANESEKDASVVIMSDEPKEEMDDFLNEQITDRQSTRIITRTGHTGSLHALSRVTSNEAKSVIILPTCGYGATDGERAQSDAHTLKTTLAVIAACEDEEVPEMVVQVYNESNKQIIVSLAEDKITVVDPEDMVAKIAVQTSRSTGLSAVYSGLIGFDGCEFYFTDADWNGIKFKDVHFHYPDGVALGVRNSDGTLNLNPYGDYELKNDDEIIILAEDDSTIKFKPKPLYKAQELQFVKKKIGKKEEKILIMGWNNKGKTILEQYEDYIIEGSEINVLPLEADEEMDKIVEEFKNKSKNIVNILQTNPYEIEQLKELEPHKYNSIVILTSVNMEQEIADANTINLLLLLREVINQLNEGKGRKPQIITEVLNSENLELISATGANDAIISTKMVSKVIAQVAEEPDVLSVYEEVFEEDGSEIYLKPIVLYISEVPETLTFADLIYLAQCRGEVCLGYRSKELMNNVSENFGIVLNPPKDKKINSSDIERIIVLSEDEL
jgi:Trk K+ transport system NAD-binding subunit